MKHKVKDNEEKVKLNRALPYLGESVVHPAPVTVTAHALSIVSYAVGNVVEVLDLPLEDDEDDSSPGAGSGPRTRKSVVVKTTMRQVWLRETRFSHRDPVLVSRSISALPYPQRNRG